MELTTTSILSLFQTTKEERQSFVSDVLSKIESGEIEPLKMHIQLKCMQDISDQIMSDKKYKSELLNEAEKYGAKKFQFLNANIEKKEVGVKYDYSQCNDSVLKELELKSAEITEKLKARQKFLQTVPISGLIVTDEQTGETFTVYPPSKSSTTSIAVTLI